VFGHRPTVASREESGGANLTRRELIQLGALSAGAVAFTGCQPPKHEMTAQSRTRLAEDLVAGHDTWYATACRGCSAGCGAIVRVVAGRAKKLEGNPDHPVNLGRSCVRAQAVVQEQYHPDRVTGPLLRTGPRGTGSFISISWDDAIARVVGQLRRLRDQGQAAEAALLTPTHEGLRARLLAGFAEAYGASWLRLEPLPQSPVREAASLVFGTDRLPAFDIANARFLLTFGANFLSTWLSPVHYGTQYGVFRQGRYGVDDFEPRAGSRPRGYMVHVEPRFSMTAANADEWVWVRPGREGMLALGLAQVILSEGLASPAGASTIGDSSALAAFVPERIAADTGVTAERIRSLARRFATERPSLAFAGGAAGGQTNGTENLSAVLALNLLVDNVGQPGGVLPNPPPIAPALQSTVRASGLDEWQGFAERLRAGRVQLVLIHDANPVHGLPGALRIGDALGQAPLVVSFSSFLDETTVLADLILPSHLPLEEWGASTPDPAPGQRVLTLQQPVVRPLYDTQSFWDVLLQMAEALGGQVRATLPWSSFREMVREIVRDPAERAVASTVGEVEREQFWTGLLQRGGLWESPNSGAAPTAPPIDLTASRAFWESGAWGAPSFAGDESAFPFHLIPFVHNSLGDGRLAHLPWLQAAPDPVTTVAWQSWVELNPRVAERYGLREGDVVGVETLIGRIDLPVYLSPAAPPDVLGIPMGQGHDGYGRWAEGRGANPMSILAPIVDEATGALAYAATRARLIVSGRTARLPKLEGTVPARQLEEEPVLRLTRESE
jgi:anaerobic selenocysteine-containing dehydrogenase